MEPTIDLLTHIHQGSHMAVQGYDEVIKDTRDAELKRTLSHMQDVHKEVALEANHRLHDRGAIPQEPHAMARLSAWAQEGLQTLLDRSPDHLVSILLDGARMGLDSTEAAIDRDFAADPDSLEFATRYRDAMRRQLDELREVRRQLH